MADVFISYATEDRDRIKPIIDAIEREGFSVWWDRRIGIGSSFDREIERELGAASCVVVIWSKHSVQSDWVRNEAQEGLDRGALVPIAIDDVRIPLAFRRAQTAQLGSQIDSDQLKRVLEAIESVIRGHQEAGATNTPSRVVPKTKYAKSGDVHIAYQVAGDSALDLVLVPGWVSHVEYAWEQPEYARFLSRLASFCRLIILDRRGTGLSDPVAELPTFEERMDDVRAVMDAANSERAVLFGISEGGPMCTLFSATYPERTISLVLYGTAAKFTRGSDYPIGGTPKYFRRNYSVNSKIDGVRE